MKSIVFASTWIIFLFLSTAFSVFGQSDTTIHNLPYQNLAEDLNLLVKQADNKRIIALGEGTHGTKEFNEVRSLITQKLIKEKGFNYVLFETNYGGAYILNTELRNGSAHLSKSMKQNLIAIWQTKEIQDFLHWLAAYNKQSSLPVNFGGIDYAELTETFNMVKTILSNQNLSDKNKLLSELQQYVSFQDEIWNNLNNRKFKFDRKKWISNGVKAYELIQNLESQINKQGLGSSELNTTLLNLKLGFETIHLFTTQKKDASRDSCMAEMIKSIYSHDSNAKVVIWAHNVHIANKPVYNGNNGGGMGAYLRKAFPDEYFSVATYTSSGTFSATTDPMPTRFNVFSAANLEAPIDGSLEKLLGQENIIFETKSNNRLPGKLKMRFIGYGPRSGPNTFTEVEPRLLYDAIIYLGRTNAAEHLMN